MLNITLKDLYEIAIVATNAALSPFVVPLNAGFSRFKVDTRLRVCHFLAQVMEESGEFQYQQEIASGADYEGRTDLGNTQRGDGVRYKGRGLIQVTGRANYAQLSRDIGVDYTDHPERLSKLPDCVNSAFWFWNSRGLNQKADEDDLVGITLAINGGLNGLADRQNYLDRAKRQIH